MTVTARSWCTGYGGLDRAVKTIFPELKTLSVSDIKPASMHLLKHRYPSIPNLGDMRWPCAADHGSADVMIGSWPCQSWSKAGTKLGAKGPKDLWPEFVKVLVATRPKIFFGENVSRIVQCGEVKNVVADLEVLGYTVEWLVCTASDVGLCHGRERVFLMAVHTDGWDFLEPQLDVPTQYSRITKRLVPLLPTPTARDFKEGTNFVPKIHKSLLPHCIKGYSLNKGQWGKFEQAVLQHAAVIGRDAPPTVESLHVGNSYRGEALSPGFVEWMQGLPKGWVTGLPPGETRGVYSRNAQLNLLGDGVVPLQAEFAFKNIINSMINVKEKVA